MRNMIECESQSSVVFTFHNEEFFLKCFDIFDPLPRAQRKKILSITRAFLYQKLNDFSSLNFFNPIMVSSILGMLFQMLV